MNHLISCPVEYLHFGGRKAEGRRQRELKEKKGLKEEGRQKAAGAEGKERFKGRRFFITNYPD
ncbi:MAG: hypothetical protein F6K17_20195, partial [Okeania sp. SIO3C4]|nr:hypothetical protein [Okeania sp. SIO3C4]